MPWSLGTTTRPQQPTPRGEAILDLPFPCRARAKRSSHMLLLPCRWRRRHARAATDSRVSAPLSLYPHIIKMYQGPKPRRRGRQVRAAPRGPRAGPAAGRRARQAGHPVRLAHRRAEQREGVWVQPGSQPRERRRAYLHYSRLTGVSGFRFLGFGFNRFLGFGLHGLQTRCGWCPGAGALGRAQPHTPTHPPPSCKRRRRRAELAPGLQLPDRRGRRRRQGRASPLGALAARARLTQLGCCRS
jgi:hypothetical protein